MPPQSAITPSGDTIDGSMGMPFTLTLRWSAIGIFGAKRALVTMASTARTWFALPGVRFTVSKGVFAAGTGNPFRDA
jgi:hypothetical protein